jgi:hypothetical protein
VALSGEAAHVVGTLADSGRRDGFWLASWRSGGRHWCWSCRLGRGGTRLRGEGQDSAIRFRDQGSQVFGSSGERLAEPLDGLLHLSGDAQQLFVDGWSPGQAWRLLRLSHRCSPEIIGQSTEKQDHAPPGGEEEHEDD